MYQGHHSDGSSIQRHSAGAWYPYVIGMQDHPQGGWFVMHPSGQIVGRMQTGGEAFSLATKLAGGHDA